MTKVLRFLAVCIISVAFATASIAWAHVTYQQVDYPGATATTLNGGPNPQGTAVGTWTDSSGVVHGLSYNAYTKNFTSFDPPGSVATTPNFITPEGIIVGSYADSGGVLHGFILARGHYQTVDYPGAAGTSLDGVSPLGEIVGFECDETACTNFHSFKRSVTGQYTKFDPPGAAISEAATENLFGVIVGGWWTQAPPQNQFLHGYVLHNGHFTTIDYPGTTSGTFCGGNNAENDIVGQWVDSSGTLHSFLLKDGNYTSFDPPGTGAGGSVAAGINIFDVIVGIYADSAGNVHGYVRLP